PRSCASKWSCPTPRALAGRRTPPEVRRAPHDRRPGRRRTVSARPPYAPLHRPRRPGQRYGLRLVGAPSTPSIERSIRAIEGTQAGRRAQSNRRSKPWSLTAPIWVRHRQVAACRGKPRSAYSPWRRTDPAGILCRRPADERKRAPHGRAVMALAPRRRARRLFAYWRSEKRTLRQGFVALLISSGGDLLAGLALASMSNRLALLPGLLVLIPAAIGMRGNIFGALGSRLVTGIHAGLFTPS